MDTFRKVNTQIHSDFNAGDADLTIRSSNGVILNLHRKYLEANTGAFPGAEFDTRGEVTHLTESSDVLEILFQFVYPRRHPDLHDMYFSTVAAVAEAAEKYEVFSAMNICQLRMKEFLPKHAPEILAHGIKHGYYGLIDEVIPLLCRSPLIPVLEKLPLDRALPWSRYYQAWNSIFEQALHHIMKISSTSSYYPCDSRICPMCRCFVFSWVLDLKEIKTQSALEDAIAIKDSSRPEGSRCSSGCRHKANIAIMLQEEIRKIPPFKKFL